MPLLIAVALMQNEHSLDGLHQTSPLSLASLAPVSRKTLAASTKATGAA